MSSTVTEEKSAAPVVQAASQQSAQSAFVQHLATYPAVTAVAGLVASFPVVKIFVSNAVPLLHAIHDRSRPVVDPLAKQAEPALKAVDELGDKILTNIDSRFPALKTVQPADLFEEAQTRINSVRDSAQQAVDVRIVQPLNTAATAAKEQYIKVYDHQGKLIATTLNSHIAPLNDRIEGIIVDYLPAEGAAELPAKDGSQVNRSYSLLKTAADRARPLAGSIQESTREHISQTYTIKLKERAGDSAPTLIVSVLAAAATGRQLAQESASRLFSVISRPAPAAAAPEPAIPAAATPSLVPEKAAPAAPETTL